ncbi:acetyl-CoA carboxylase biotin carboxyl carrier protein [Bacillus aryabhattai]|uniref:Biotin carboxyl carrier protein of acetyl-CoA carboxylase n=2 Tax=Priestia TaxID=2800373 RepID=A0A7W3NF14_PRIAR|nr:acetyl-CoA carboxylase biotin carboxyl carrier protein [Priestia aryabhattai]MBA9041799.1 acetyl-CoA carboxylase biotin carboxyl carrier protein [Priestia aryabhattai]
MEITDIQALIDALDQSSISELEYEKKEVKIKLKKVVNEAHEFSSKPKEDFEKNDLRNPTLGVQENDSKTIHQQEIKNNLYQINSPMVGTFYNSSSPTEDPYVKIGQEVNENTIVCMVEAMKLFNEIESEVKGQIEDILVENGELVEYGQPLFLVARK